MTSQFTFAMATSLRINRPNSKPGHWPVADDYETSSDVTHYIVGECTDFKVFVICSFAPYFISCFYLRQSRQVYESSFCSGRIWHLRSTASLRQHNATLWWNNVAFWQYNFHCPLGQIVIISHYSFYILEAPLNFCPTDPLDNRKRVDSLRYESDSESHF